MATLNTNFSDTEGRGTIILYENPFKNSKNGSQYYGRFRRNTVDIKTLIARIQKRKAGTNELALQQVAGFIKEEILEALTRGESVNILDLGFMYIAPKSGFNEKDGKSENGKSTLTVKFTPSQTVRSKVEKIEINDILIADVNPQIFAVTDQFTKGTDGILTKGKTVFLEGERLKIAGDDGGVFLCPVEGEKKTVCADETKWLKSPQVTKNTMKNLIFYIPDEAVEETEYRILVRTFYSNAYKFCKAAKETVSDVVSVKD